MKRYKSQIFLSAIIILLLGKLVLSVENDKGYNYKYILSNKILAFFDGAKNNEYNSDFLPTINLTYDKEWEKHVQKLSALISIADFKNYSRLNKYFPGSLSIEGETFKVKIKIHGKRPDGHIYKDHISLKVKFLNNKNPFNSTKIKLQVAHRIATSFDNMKILAKLFSIVHTEGFWYNLKINDKNNYQYLVQIPMGDDFTKNHTEIKSLIDFADAPYNLTTIDSSTIVKFNKPYKNQVKSILDNLRNDIIAQDNSNIFNYFDKEYISNFMACNLVGGFLGHGFAAENIYILYNTSNKKLYPMITRDNFISPLTSGMDEFEQISTWSHFSRGNYMQVKNELISFLATSVKLRVLALNQIKLKSTENLDSLRTNLNVYEQFSNPKSFLENTFQPEENQKTNYRLSWKMYKSDLIKYNLKFLQERLRKNYYSSHQFIAKDSIVIMVKNHSILPLILSKFELNIKPNELKNIQLQIISNNNIQLDSIVNTNKVTSLQLSQVVNKFHLFDKKTTKGEDAFLKIKLLFHGDHKFKQHPYDAKSLNLEFSNYSEGDSKPIQYINQNHISFE